MPRSGTTLTEQIITQLTNEVSGAGELAYVREAVVTIISLIQELKLQQTKNT